MKKRATKFSSSTYILCVHSHTHPYIGIVLHFSVFLFFFPNRHLSWSVCVCVYASSCASQNKNCYVFKGKRRAHWAKLEKKNILRHRGDLFHFSFFTNQQSFLIKDTGNNKKAWRERFHTRHAISLPSTLPSTYIKKIDSTPWYSSDWYIKKITKNKQN